MKDVKKIITLLLVVALSLSMTACSSLGSASFEESVVQLVQGNLDSLYLGQFNEDYLELVNAEEEECRADYQAGLRTEAEFFAYYFDISYPTEEILTEIEQMYEQIYSKSRYTVSGASELDENTYAVKVQISPIDIIQLAVDNSDAQLAPFFERYQDVDVMEMTDEEYEAYDAEWASAVIQLVESQLPNMGYMDEQSIAVQIVKGDDDIWRIADSDMVKIDELMIYYP